MEFFAILGNPKILSAMAMTMSIYGTLCVLVFSQVVLPFPVPAFERTFSINDPDLPKIEKELHGDVALKLPSGFKVDQLK